MYYLFHDKVWMCFEGELPVKPTINSLFKEGTSLAAENRRYNQAIATLKSKALVVANPQICPQNMSQVKEGEIYEWPGTVTRALGDFGNTDQYILHLPKQKKIHNNIPPLPEYFYIEGPDEFVKGEPTATDEAKRMAFARLKYQIGQILTSKFLEYNEGKFHTTLELNPAVHAVTEFVWQEWEQFKKDNGL